MADELVVAVVGQLEGVVLAAQHGEEGGRLLEDGGEPRALEVQLVEEARSLLLGAHARRRLLADDQRSTDRAVIGVHGAVAVRPPDVLEASVALDREILVLVPGGRATGHDLLDLRSDGFPDVGPAFAPAHAERLRVPPAAAEAGAIGVVVDLNELRAPPEEHRRGRVENDLHDRAKAERPRRDRTERGRAPVEGATERAHLAGAGEDAVLGVAALQLALGPACSHVVSDQRFTVAMPPSR